MAPKNLFTFKLDATQQSELASILKTGNFKPCVVPYTIIAVDAASWNCHVNLYTSGKCLIQGKGAQEFVLNIMEPQVLKCATIGYEDETEKIEEPVTPHAGVDESGKGDFFGPLVVAAAYADETLAKTLKDMGVRDSKLITSDAQALKLGMQIRKLLGPNRYTVLRIGNPTYNRLYSKIKSVNRLLAWGHARCIENILTTMPTCPRAISDQFGTKEGVERALMKKGKNIILEQRHRAESDIAVAAASIIAREGFLQSLAAMKEKYGQVFPKGASPQVRETAEALVRVHGPAVLIDVAKCHFRTTDAVLKATEHTREELPPEGRVVSQDFAGRDFHRKPEENGDSLK